MPIELSNSRKGLIKIRNNDQKCFLWCHVRHINPVEEDPGRIKKTDRINASNLNYEGIEFPVQEKDLKKIEVQNNICNNVFCYGNELVYPIFISKQTFEDSIDLLLLIRNNKSHYAYIKDFNAFMFHKTKNKNKKWFSKSFLQCFSSKNVLIKHKEDCLSINGMQSVDVEEGIIKFENYSKQLPVPFKIMLILNIIYKILKFMRVLAQRNIMIMSLVVMLLKLLALIIDLVNQLLFTEVKMLLMNLLKQFFKNISIART